MFFDPACIPCIINQAYKAAVYFSFGNKALELSIVKDVCAEVNKGILVDDYLRTSEEDIFAVGECAAKYDFFTDDYSNIMLASTAMTNIDINTLQIRTHPLLTASPIVYPVINAATEAIKKYYANQNKIQETV